MARIRSIKPDFWRDDKIAALKNQRAGFFFIGLWNFADDEGKFKLNPKALSLQMPIFRSKDILTYIRDLSELGLIQISVCSGWGLVTNWHHQRIDRPILPKVKAEEIQWLPVGHSWNGRESSTSTRRKDRIGKDQDRIGKDSHEGREGEVKALETSKARSAPVDSKPTWEAYSKAYHQRHGVLPTRNARVNSQLAQFLKRVPLEEAPEIAEFYVFHNRAFYVQKSHPVGLMLQDAESLRTEWLTGKQVTVTEARGAETKQQLFNAFAKFLKPETEVQNDEQ